MSFPNGLVPYLVTDHVLVSRFRYRQFACLCSPFKTVSYPKVNERLQPYYRLRNDETGVIIKRNY